jgi:hypothetical protein
MQYDHNGYEDNADAHLKRSVMGREVVVTVTDGKLDFGTWERIFYGEFDGMRDKRVLVVNDGSPCPETDDLVCPRLDENPVRSSPGQGRKRLFA